MNSEISTYTITVYELKEYNFDFGLDEYPIFDEAYRETLNNAILEFYMFREIGYANPALWRQRLRNRMDIIMRNKYNDLYKAKAKEFNPLYTMELYEEYTHDISNEGIINSSGEVNSTSNSSIDASNTQNNTTNISNTNTTNNSALGLTSQFPSQEMTENDITSNLFVDNANKATSSATIIDSGENSVEVTGSNNVVNSGSDTTTNSNNGTTNNTMSETYNKKTYGSASDLSFAHAMTQFRDYIEQFQIDKQIIDELKDLFMQIW